MDAGPIEASQSLKKCIVCSVEIGPEARFCPACGAPQNTRRETREQKKQVRVRWKLVRNGIVFYAIYLVSIVPLYWMAVEQMAMGMIVIAVIDVLIILGYRRFANVSLRPQLALNSRVFLYSLAGLAFLPAFLLLNWAQFALLRRWLGIETTNLCDVFFAGGWGVSAIFLIVCVMPAFWEEIAFRGLLQSSLTQAIGEREAILLTAIFFATIHTAFLSWPYLFLLGFFLGILRRRSGSLWPGIFLHFFHNFSVTAMEWLDVGRALK